MDAAAEVAVPESELPSTATVVETPGPAAWSPLGRIAFRVAFLYFFTFIFCFGNGTIFSIFPVVGDWIDTVCTWPFNHLAEWTGQSVFHLTGLAAHWHPTGSGDTTLNWILNGLFIVFALVGGLVWTLASMLRGNRRKEYQTLYDWLRWGLRLTCGFFMVNYGMAKVFPLQMAPISIAILNEPVGNMSPMTFLWALIGMNPVYEIVCGAAEVVGGILLLYRRTALLGALISAFVMTNVVLYNFFFDVPVKVFAVNLLLALIFLTVADLPALFSFFALHRPAFPSGRWIPQSSRRWARITLRVFDWVFSLAFIIGLTYYTGQGWIHAAAAAKVQTPLLGAWRVDSKSDPAHPAPGALVTPEGLLATDLYIDTSARAFTRATDGELWRTRLTLDAKAQTLQVAVYTSDPVKYRFQMPDSDHLVLTSTPPEAGKGDAKPDPKNKPTPAFTPVVVAFTRTPVPSHYPLLDRGFHFVNQWGLER